MTLTGGRHSAVAGRIARLIDEFCRGPRPRHLRCRRARLHPPAVCGYRTRSRRVLRRQGSHTGDRDSNHRCCWAGRRVWPLARIESTTPQHTECRKRDGLRRSRGRPMVQVEDGATISHLVARDSDAGAVGGGGRRDGAGRGRRDVEGETPLPETVWNEVSLVEAPLAAGGRVCGGARSRLSVIAISLRAAGRNRSCLCRSHPKHVQEGRI